MSVRARAARKPPERHLRVGGHSPDSAGRLTSECAASSPGRSLSSSRPRPSAAAVRIVLGRPAPLLGPGQRDHHRRLEPVGPRSSRRGRSPVIFRTGRHRVRKLGGVIAAGAGPGLDSRPLPTNGWSTKARSPHQAVRSLERDLVHCARWSTRARLTASSRRAGRSRVGVAGRHAVGRQLSEGRWRPARGSSAARSRSARRARRSRAGPRGDALARASGGNIGRPVTPSTAPRRAGGPSETLVTAMRTCQGGALIAGVGDNGADPAMEPRRASGACGCYKGRCPYWAAAAVLGGNCLTGPPQ
jgi:hypothetical protein